MKSILLGIFSLLVHLGISQNASPDEALIICDPQEITLLNTPCDSILWDANEAMNTAQLTEQFPSIWVEENMLFMATLFGSGESWEEEFEIQRVFQPLVELNASVQEGCSPLGVVLSLNNPQEEVVWTLENGQQSYTGNSIVHVYEYSGEYYPEVEYQYNECVYSQLLASPIIVESSPEINIEIVSGQLNSNSPNLTALGSAAEAIQFTWTTNTGLFSEAEQINFVIESDTNIEVELCLEASTNLGCSAISCETMQYLTEPNVFVPEAFSPNYDGLNDGFGPVCFGVRDQNYRLVIWNRWGQRVFESADPEEKWDAINAFNGADAAAGMYFWNLQYQGHNSTNVTEISGDFVLLR
ncbi:MAG: gliding motility-associated C-terminal domain-containing protein [Bacteroidota bacterium]